MHNSIHEALSGWMNLYTRSAAAAPLRYAVLTGFAMGACAPRVQPPAVPSAAGTPCTTPTTPCEEWVTLAGGPARSMVYSTYPLDKPNPRVTRALIMVHGTNRNADDYFATAVGAAFFGRALDNTIVIAPRIIASPDTAQVNEVVWPNRGDTWRSGGMSPSHPALSAFDFMDEILRKLENKNFFPNLSHIVVAGHSAGGQFVNRYGMTNKVHDALGASVSYVVANPSSYAWPTPMRPLPTGDADPATAEKAPLGAEGEKVHTNYSFGPFDSAKARTYNRWPSGLESRSGYTAVMSDDQIRKQLIERPTTYLLGQVDVLPLGGFDNSPSAVAQGPTRRARGEAYFKYVTEKLGARHRAIIVPECGHNNRCVFTTDEVLPVIFPD